MAIHRYKTPDEQYDRFKLMLKYLIFIGIFGVLIVIGGIRLTHYVEDTQVTVLKESFSEFAIRDMPDLYHVTPGKDLQPLYTFQQGEKDAKTYYTGIVFAVQTTIDDALSECLGLSKDSPEYLTIRNNCVDHFEAEKEGIPTEKIRTKEGKAVAVSFSIPKSSYQYFIFRVETETSSSYQIMARQTHNNLT